jgi:hypothetical protein
MGSKGPCGVVISHASSATSGTAAAPRGVRRVPGHIAARVLLPGVRGARTRGSLRRAQNGKVRGLSRARPPARPSAAPSGKRTAQLRGLLRYDCGAQRVGRSRPARRGARAGARLRAASASRAARTRAPGLNRTRAQPRLGAWRRDCARARRRASCGALCFRRAGPAPLAARERGAGRTLLDKRPRQPPAETCHDARFGARARSARAHHLPHRRAARRPATGRARQLSRSVLAVSR